MAILELRDVSFKYQLGKETVLENINLSIEQGEFVACIGRNGAGKTTLCSIMRGLIPNFQNGTMTGDVFLNGQNMKELTLGQIAQKVGFVFQNPFIQVSGIKKTVFEEIAYGLENLGVPRVEMIERTNAIITQLKIEYLRDKHPMQLSGGQSQRVALASVLVMDPEILIIDEPTSQLDPQGTEEVFETINILKQRHKTIILVEHKIDLVSEYADRVILIDQKHILLDGPTSVILTDISLLDHGVSLPQVALLALRVEEETGKKLDRIPSVIEDAVTEFSRLV